MRIVIVVAAVLAVAALASAQMPQQHIKRTNPPTLSTPTGYTHVVETVGPVKTIYISGQIAFDKAGNVVGAGDMKAQAEQVFRNLDVALKAAGATFADVVKMNSYITDMTKAQAVRDVRARYFARRHAGEHVRRGEGARPTRADAGSRGDCRRSRRRSHRTGYAIVVGCW